MTVDALHKRLTAVERRLAILENAPPQVQRLFRTAEIGRRFGITRQMWRRWVVSQQAPQPLPNLPGHPAWAARDIDRFERGRAGRRFF
jgi:hypothetical protein